MSETDYGAALRDARKRAGRTITDLARELGTSPATISRLETGHIRLTEGRLNDYATALGVRVGDLDQAAPPGTNGTALFRPSGTGSWRAYAPLALPPALDAALQNFLQLGYHGTSVRDIARMANLSAPGLYHHYASKQDLLVAIMDLTMTDFRARCEAARTEGQDPLERFSNLVECFALYHSHRRELAFVGASEMRSLEKPHRRRITDLRISCQRMVDRELTEMVEAGFANVESAEDAARAVVVMLVGIATWYQSAGALTPEEVARRYVVHALAMVRAPGPVTSF